MKNFVVSAVFMLIACAGYSQSNKEDVDMIQAMYGKQKKELIQAYMTIPAAQKDSFWSVYDRYEGERKALGRERISLIEAYANSYATLDDKKASELMNRKMVWTEKYIKLQKKYFGTLQKTIGSVQASKFFQLEDYLENNIRLYTQESIPFIDELDKTKIKSATEQH